MSALEVSSVQVPGIMERLKRNEWLVPEFQRDFVWSVSDIKNLALSIIDSRPIGMATLWEQEEDAIPLEPLSINDYDIMRKERTRKYIGDVSFRPAKYFAILDGRQRCTAIAMAFGGFRPDSWRMQKFFGRYFLNVTASDDTQRVTFLKESEVKKRSLDLDAVCIANGLFPLASSIADEPLMQQWMRYLQALKDPANYPNGKLPPDDELIKRNRILTRAFEGIVETKLAIYVVPKAYDLSQICEIFETLNTTGTRVSTVDLIHSSLYSASQPQGESFLLRDWIDELGEFDGAIGWSSASDRPELIAQTVTACYLALEEKAAPKPVRGVTQRITSIKAGDLLATPFLHWKKISEQTATLANFLGDFQDLVAGGRFPHTLCPYPVSAAIYVALRWHHANDDASLHQWTINNLNSIYRAFFWRNALANRYDQGFLTQLGYDLVKLKQILTMRPKFDNDAKWASYAEDALSDMTDARIPSREELETLLTDGRPGGATQRAALLPMYGKIRCDFLNPEFDLTYPESENRQLHHIFPKRWCYDNSHGDFKNSLDKNFAGKDYVDSVANLMPMDRRTNLEWRSKSPAAFLDSYQFTAIGPRLKPVFIDEKGFDLLKQGIVGCEDFWKHRASLIAADLLERTHVGV